MKTAVEKLMIDYFGKDFRMTINDYQLNAFQNALEKEKEQMLAASISGSKGNSFEDYYNQTYKQP